MAWKLQLPTGGYISIPIWSVAANQDFVIDIVFDTPPTLAVDGVLGNSTDSSFLAVFNSGAVETKLNGTHLTGISGSPANANIFVASNQYRWRVERVSNSCRVTITNLTTSTVKQDVSGASFSGAFSFTWIGNTQGLILGGGRFYTVALSRAGDNRLYDASASGGSGTILPDTASGQNGTQVGTWPSDNSEWVFYSDGGAVTASATYDIGGIGFAISANEIDPAITAAVGYDIGGLSFAVSSTVTAPGVTTSLAYDIGSIGFSASATVGVNASGAYDIGDIGFAVSASAATNSAVSSVAYDIGPVGFSIGSSVSVVNTVSTSYDIGSINFAVSSILVTNASGAINYDIGGVTYSVNANAPLNEPERSLSGKDNPFWRKSIFFNTQRRY